MTTLAGALDYMSERQDNRTQTYREMCELIVASRDKLSYRVFIHLPGGLSGNNDSSWDAIKASSRELCSCGNERVIEPLNMRGTFVSSDDEPVVMGLGDKVYIRPIGAPASAAYVLFQIQEADDGHVIWTFLDDPMSTAVNFMDLLGGPKGYELNKLKSAIDGESTRPVPFMKGTDAPIPIVGIQSVDVTAKTVTLILEAGVEMFELDEEPVHQH